MKTRVNQKKDKQTTRVNTPVNTSKSRNGFRSDNPENVSQQKQAETIENSSLLTLQQKKLNTIFGNTIQKETKPDEKLTQKKQAIQRDYAEEVENENADKSISGSFQAKISSEDANEITQQKPIQRDKEEDEEEKLPVQEKRTNGAIQRQEKDEEEKIPGQAKFETVQRQKNNTGIPDNVKNKMESSFNTDFSNVKVHAGSNKAPEVGALAYTQGHDIHFAPGQFKPETSSGQQLLGHELAHVVQQREGRVKPTTEVAGLPVNDNPSLENEADTLGAKASK